MCNSELDCKIESAEEFPLQAESLDVSISFPVL